MTKFAIVNEHSGTFMGIALGLVFFSKDDTVGQTFAATAPNEAEAAKLIEDLSKAGIRDLRAVPVRSGHWRDLKEAGLHIGDMDSNELLYGETKGTA